MSNNENTNEEKKDGNGEEISDELKDLMTPEPSKSDEKKSDSTKKKKRSAKKEDSTKSGESSSTNVENSAPKPEEKPPEVKKTAPKPVVSSTNFRIKFKNSKSIRTVFKGYASSIEEAKLKVDPQEGLKATAMDGAHILLGNLKISKKDMDEFVADEFSEIGISLIDMVKILDRSEATEAIGFETNKSDRNMLMTFQLEKGTKKRKFKLNFIDITTEEVGLESLSGIEFPNKIVIDPKVLDQSIKDAEIFSEILTWFIKENKLHLSTIGSTGEMDNELGKEEFKESQLTTMGEMTYAIQYLKSVIKIQDTIDQIEIQFGDGLPLHIKAKLFTDSFLEYYLAPRVAEANESDNMDD